MRRMKIVLTVAVLLSLALSATAFSNPITITASAWPRVGGTITPSGNVPIFPGANQTFVIKPSTGHEIRNVTVDGISQGKIGIYTFSNITANHSIKATFKVKTYTTTITAGENVTISPSGARRFKHGQKVNFTVTPPSRDIIPIVMVDGKEVQRFSESNPNGLKKTAGGYRFLLTVTGDHSVMATSPITPMVPETTQHVDETTIQSIAEGGSVTFSQATTFLPGDIIVGDATTSTPNGLLRKVTSVSPDGTLVETTPVSLEEAIENGQVQVSKLLTSGDVSSFTALREGVSFQRNVIQAQALDFIELINVILYDHDGDLDTENDQIKVNGSILLTPSFDLYMEINNFKLTHLVFSNTVTQATDLQLVSQFSGELSVFDIERIHELAEINFSPFTVWIGWVPIVIVPKLSVNVGINGDVSIGITSRATQEAQLTAGLSYNNGQWTNISTFQSDFGFDPPSLSEGNANITAYAGLQLELLLYDTAGPYAEVNGYLTLDADLLSDPWWELYAGLEAHVGVKVEMLGEEIVDYEFPWAIDYRKLLADSNTVRHQVDYSGNWRGAWSGGWGGGGSLNVNISQSEYGTTITGNVSASNSGMPSNQFFLGEVDGTVIEWVTANYGQCTMTAAGDAASATHLSGTYEVVCNGEFWDNGTWFLDKQS